MSSRDYIFREDAMNQASETKNRSAAIKKLRQIVTLGALLLALIHLIWPSLALDPITLALIIIAILPWLSPLIKSLELPGGWKIEFWELQRAASRAESAGLLASKPSKTEEAFSFESIAKRDPNLALAGLRIEIEKRLSLLARAYCISSDRPTGINQLLRALTQAEVLTDEERSILFDMTNLLNSAVHGATVDSRAADWAINIGPRLLTSFDDKIKEASHLTKPTAKLAKPGQ